jgi:hypothetical protein
MHVQLPSQVQPYLYVYIDLILRYYMFRLDAIIRYFVSWPCILDEGIAHISTNSENYCEPCDIRVCIFLIISK